MAETHCSNTSPIRAVRDHISQDTMETLEWLLDEARKGKIIGIAYAALGKQREVIVDAVGESNRNIILTKGMVSFLDAELNNRLNARDW